MDQKIDTNARFLDDFNFSKSCSTCNRRYCCSDRRSDHTLKNVVSGRNDRHEKLSEYLKENSINFKEYLHKAVFTVAESSELKKSIPGLHCKCLFLKDEFVKFYLVAMPAEKRLDIKELREKINVKKLHFGSEEELFDNLGLKPGSVSIFGMINASGKKVMLIVDKDVWNADYVGFHPNINTSTLVISHENLERFYNSLNNDKRVMEL